MSPVFYLSMKAELTAQIYDLKTRATKSNDKTTQIVLEQDNLSIEIKNALNALQDSKQNESRELRVVISDE